MKIQQVKDSCAAKPKGCVFQCSDEELIRVAYLHHEIEFMELGESDLQLPGSDMPLLAKWAAIFAFWVICCGTDVKRLEVLDCGESLVSCFVFDFALSFTFLPSPIHSCDKWRQSALLVSTPGFRADQSTPGICEMECEVAGSLKSSCGLIIYTQKGTECWRNSVAIATSYDEIRDADRSSFN